MSTAFGVTPQMRSQPPPRVVKAIDRDAPLQMRKAGDKWSLAEVSVLRERASMGMSAVVAMLPNRPRTAIHKKAQDEGIQIARLTIKSRSRGRLKVPPSAHPLVKTLIVEANKAGVTLCEMEEQAGLGNGTISEWRRRRSPGLCNLIAAFNSIGLDLQVVPIEEVKSQANYL